jgi:hypothetical protein
MPKALPKDPAVFDRLMERSKSIISNLQQRDDMNSKIENLYFMKKSSSMPTNSWVMPITSPSPRNKIIGAVRLLTAAGRPKFKIPDYTLSEELEAEAAKTQWETYADVIYANACRARGKEIGPELALIGLLYAEITVGVRLTSDLLILETDPLRRKRLEQIASYSPVLFDLYTPKVSFPIYDELGLSEWVLRQQMPLAEIESIIGTGAWSKDKMPTDKMSFVEYHSSEYHMVALEDEEIFTKENTLGYIPIASKIIEGSELFSESDNYTRHPLLFPLVESGLWDYQNMLYTYLASRAKAMGSTAQNIYTKGTPSSPDAPEVNWDKPFGQMRLNAGDKMEAYDPRIIDPGLVAMIGQTENLMNESTIYSSAFGEPQGENAAFSMIAMLASQGRQPLIPYQMMNQLVVSEMMYIAFRMLKDSGGQVALGKQGPIKLDFKKLPDTFDITCNWDLDLPSDERTNAAVAAQVTGSNNMSRTRAMEKLLGIEHPDKEFEKIWEEQMADAQVQMQIKAMVARMETQIEIEKQQAMMQLQTQAAGAQEAQSAAIQGQAQQQQMAQAAQMQQQQQMQQMQPPGGPPQGPPQGPPAQGTQSVPPEMLAQGGPEQGQEGNTGGVQPGNMIPPPELTGAEQGLAGMPATSPLPPGGGPVLPEQQGTPPAPVIRRRIGR